MQDKNSVGVIVGRFQVDELHKGHKNFIKYVASKHNQVLIFIGVSHSLASKENPLDFNTRSKLIQTFMLNFEVKYKILPIKDQKSNAVWSFNLDEVIKSIYPLEKVVLYGHRDSFINSYTGRFEIQDISDQIPEGDYSGTNIRENIKHLITDSADSSFRQGVIWSTQNRYPRVDPVVDIILFQQSSIDNKPYLYLGQKENEDKLRFFGGFVDPSDISYAHAAKRELYEESRVPVDVRDLINLGSCKVNDWRYSGQDKMMTNIFFTKLLMGIPEPNDDIAKIHQVEYSYTRLKTLLIEEHLPILDIFNEYIIRKG